jgi:hypothetical protein
MRNGFTSDTSTRAPFRSRDQRDQCADGAAAERHGVFARFHFAEPHVVTGDGDGFDERALLERERFRQPMQRMRGNRQQRLHRARTINADDFELHANVRIARFARRTRAAGIERTHSHAVSRRPGRYTFANRLNDA